MKGRNYTLTGADAVAFAVGNDRHISAEDRECAEQIFDDGRLIRSAKWHDAKHVREAAGGNASAYAPPGVEDACYTRESLIIEEAHRRGIPVRIHVEVDAGHPGSTWVPWTGSVKAGIHPSLWACRMSTSSYMRGDKREQKAQFAQVVAVPTDDGFGGDA